MKLCKGRTVGAGMQRRCPLSPVATDHEQKHRIPQYQKISQKLPEVFVLKGAQASFPICDLIMLLYQIANRVIIMSYVFSNPIINNIFAFETTDDNILASSAEFEWSSLYWQGGVNTGLTV